METKERNRWLYLPTNTVFEDWFAAKRMLGTNRARRLIKEKKLVVYKAE